MPNSDTWPRAVAMDPSLSNMDSAGSCDSVISVNSGFSEDSMEHLSAEERACLMYLEETIESLDVQEDSGLSNDEPDSAILRLKHDELDILGLTCKKHPTDGGSSTSTNDLCVQHKTETQTLDPQLVSPSTHNTSDTSVHISKEPVTPDTDAATSVPALYNKLSSSTEEDPPSVCTEAVISSKASSEVEMALIPPPSDFMDEPGSPPQMNKIQPPATSTPDQKPTIDLEVLRRRISERSSATAPVSPPATAPESPPATSPESPPATPPESPPATPPESPPATPLESPPATAPVSLPATAPVSPPATAPENPSVPLDKSPSELSAAPASSPSSLQTGSLPVASPPAVAPKPKKLPPNIILKSHKSSGSYEGCMGHPGPSTANRLSLDPQQVRMEALRKLGLLKSEESDSGFALTPKPHQSRRSWAAPASPLSPPLPKATPSSAPYARSVHTSPPVHTLIPPTTQTVVYQTSTVPSEPLPDIIPVPAAFSDPVEPSHDDVFFGDSEPVLTDLHRQLTTPKGCGVKSATLDRSGLGLSSYMESLENNKSLSELRNSRPRPASLGSGKDFSSAHGGVAHTGSKVPDGTRCVPAPSTSLQSDSSQKLPRSQGISVLICPHAQNEESRREALKKLGLLRD